MSTRGYCLFCLDHVQPTNHLDTTKTFIKYLQCYTKTDNLANLLNELDFTKIPPTLVLDCCEKCQRNVDEFCEIYHKIKCLEIQLELKLDGLVNTIKQTDKVIYPWHRVSALLANIFYIDKENKQKCRKMITQFRENIVTGHQKLISFNEADRKAGWNNDESWEETDTQQEIAVPLPNVEPPATEGTSFNTQSSSERNSSADFMETNDLVDNQAKSDDDGNCYGIQSARKSSDDVTTPAVSQIQLKIERQDISNDDDEEQPNFANDNQYLTVDGDSNGRSCVKCGKTCKSKQALKRHTLDKHSERTVSCPNCKCKFHFEAELRKHIKIHSNPDQWKWLCKICDKKFPFQRKLNQHMRIHTMFIRKKNPRVRNSIGVSTADADFDRQLQNVLPEQPSSNPLVAIKTEPGSPPDNNQLSSS